MIKPIPRELAASLAPRIMQSVTVNRVSQCWIRTSGVNSTTGYSTVSTRVGETVKYFLAHRVMYTFWHGEIPDGLEIDHLCDTPPCCNPAHLTPATHRENVLRSSTNPTAINARRTHCKNGHLLVPIYGGGRGCPICKKQPSTSSRTATCSWCDQLCHLRTNGLIRRHRVVGDVCPGSGQPPAQGAA